MLYYIKFSSIEYFGTVFDAYHLSLHIYRIKERDPATFKEVYDAIQSSGSIVYSPFKDLIKMK